MLDALHAQVQARREKLEGVVMEFGVICVVTTIAKENVATKVTNKVRFTKYSNK
jgi:hypothetical protein